MTNPHNYAKWTGKYPVTDYHEPLPAHDPHWFLMIAGIALVLWGGVIWVGSVM